MKRQWTICRGALFWYKKVNYLDIAKHLQLCDHAKAFPVTVTVTVTCKHKLFNLYKLLIGHHLFTLRLDLFESVVKCNLFYIYLLCKHQRRYSHVQFNKSMEFNLNVCKFDIQEKRNIDNF